MTSVLPSPPTYSALTMQWFFYFLLLLSSLRISSVKVIKDVPCRAEVTVCS